MKNLIRAFYLPAAALSITIIGGFFTEVFAQPPPLPNGPYQVPWENFVLTAVVCLGYGAFRIIKKR